MYFSSLLVKLRPVLPAASWGSSALLGLREEGRWHRAVKKPVSQMLTETPFHGDMLSLCLAAKSYAICGLAAVYINITYK